MAIPKKWRDREFPGMEMQVLRCQRCHQPMKELPRSQELQRKAILFHCADCGRYAALNDKGVNWMKQRDF